MSGVNLGGGVEQVHEVLRETEELSRAVLRSLSAHIAVLDKDGNVIAVNEAWSRSARENGVLGGAAGVGANYLSVCRQSGGEPGDPVPEALPGIQAVLAGAQRSFAMEYPSRPPARERWFQLSVTPLLRKDGGAVVAHSDITERVRMEQALRESEAALQRHREELRALTAGLLTAQEQERKRVSRELHDDLNQKLAMLAVDVEALERRLPASSDDMRSQLRSIGNRVASLSDDVRRVAYGLHPSILEHLGLTVALRCYCKEFAKREAIQVTFRNRKAPESLPQDVALCLYRVAQESLRNVARHSGAKRVVVTLAGVAGGVHLSIKDYGVGFDPRAAKRKGGLGLVSMEERVRLVNGTLAVKAAPGNGTQVDFRIPLPEDKA